MALIKQRALQTHLVPVISRFTSPLPAVGEESKEVESEGDEDAGLGNVKDFPVDWRLM